MTPLRLPQHLRRRLIGALLTSVSFVALAALLVPGEPGTPPSLDITGIAPVVQTFTGSGACDVDGVAVSYQTVFKSTPTAGYYVTNAVVGGIAWPSCNGATVSVQLTTAASAVIGSGSVPVGGSPSGGSVSTTVALSPQPDARPVTGVNVTLSGGTTPIPSECSSITFSNVQVGTTGNDSMLGTNGNDLLYGLTGVDRLDSNNNGSDCLNGGPGAGDNDTFIAGNGNNVILAGHGNDSVTAGNGTNTIYLGTGTSSITVGNGNDIVFTGGRTSTSSSNGPSGGVGTTTTRVGNGNSIGIYGGNGNDVIYLGNGGGTVDGGGGTNTCHLPSLSKFKYTITNCTKVSP